jgi:hypothetical protein
MPLLQNSPEHIAEVARIDSAFNAELFNARAHFEQLHGRGSAEDNPAWLEIAAGVEAKRQERFAEMREWITFPAEA